MTKVLLIYSSMTGNTEEMAEAIAEGVKERASLEVKDVLEAEATEMIDYDGLLLGAYTWGDGELPDEFLDFYDDMEELDLRNKKAAVFGSCDSSYPHFGAAVDILIETLQACGAEVVLPGLKVELSPTDEQITECKQFGFDFIHHLLHRREGHEKTPKG
ncbi:flavodoxin [Melghirimyces algeriensis]|uniref:Flavodoxin n=1 Tax=Melghirimyces algeriensis TaxID=910412 RepID=A0A521FKB2_9BACL|nr:flavodoxin [Melghirimyces algeriensis]SMO95941.1 flavodoxin I [Melghirimyces algeriensis]